MAATTKTAPDAAIEAVIDVQPAEEPEREFITLLVPRMASYEEGPEDERVNMDVGPSDKYAADHDERNIKFNETEPGGPGMARTWRGHPALVPLLQRYPDIKIVEPETKRSFVCEVCAEEFREAKNLILHKQTH